MISLKWLTSKKTIYHIVKWFIWLSLILAFYGAIRTGSLFTLFVATFTFLLTLTPIFFKRLHINFPQELELTIIVFVYATLFLGEIKDYYTLYWWWDVLMHGVSAIALGFIGLGVLYTLDKKGQIDAKTGTLVFFAFCFVMAIGAVWEIFEFSMDQTFGLNMQKSGLLDTMWDFIVDALGGLISSVVGYFYIEKERKLRSINGK